MSKKQREKVEDEVRYHREINSQAQHAASVAAGGSSGSLGSAGCLSVTPGGTSTQPDSSVFDAPQPSSTEHVYGG